LRKKVAARFLSAPAGDWPVATELLILVDNWERGKRSVALNFEELIDSNVTPQALWYKIAGENAEFSPYLIGLSNAIGAPNAILGSICGKLYSFRKLF
jgi:hypothetical protein